MLQASFEDRRGNTVLMGPNGNMVLMDGQLGWPSFVDKAVSSVGSAVSSAASSVVSGVKTAANATGNAVVAAGKGAVSALEKAANAACGVLTNTSVQSGASMASAVPHPAAQGAATATQTAGMVCNVAYPPKTNTGTQQVPAPAPAPVTAGRPTYTLSTAVKTLQLNPAVVKSLTSMPAGSKAAFDPKIGKFRVAKPISAMLGGPTENSGFDFNNNYTAPFMRQYNWTGVQSADSPYRATWGLGALPTLMNPLPTIMGAALGGPAFVEAGIVDQVPAGVQVVSLTEYQRDTGTLPWFKNPYVWAAIGGGLAVAGGVAYAVRRKRS